MRIDAPISRSAISSTFKQALQHQPSLVVVEDIQRLAGSYEPGSSSQSTAASILVQEIDRLRNSRVLVVGTTRRLDEVDRDLRVSHRFPMEIEIPVPNAQARKDFLHRLGTKHIASNLLDKIGEETHGYVMADLNALMLHASVASLAREMHEDEVLGPREHASFHEFQLTAEDFEEAKGIVPPSAMREVFLETPNVKWSDIGGSEEVKEQLKRITEWPLTVSNQKKTFSSMRQLTYRSERKPWPILTSNDRKACFCTVLRAAPRP